MSAIFIDYYFHDFYYLTLCFAHDAPYLHFVISKPHLYDLTIVV